MALLNKKKRPDPEIPGSSLADIAFLLLIFFLVTTTINVDTGIGLTLPPIPDENIEPPPIKERNLLNILVNAQGLVLLDETPSSITEVKQKVKDFITNCEPGNPCVENLSEDPTDAIISIKTDRQTPYNIYINMLDEVIGAYNELRDEKARALYGVPFSALEETSEQYQSIAKDVYPKKISIAEPDEGNS